MVKLVTGASGFIGRRLAARLDDMDSSCDLQCLVKNVESGFCQSGLDILASRQIRVTRVDLVSGAGLSELIRPSVLFHLAGNTHTWEQDHSCNDRGTENVLSAVGPLGAANHVVFTSSTAVLDNRESLAEPLQPQATVQAHPFTCYGKSKWRAERFLRAEAARQGFPLSIVRLCTVYGPQPRPNTLFDVLKAHVAKGTVASRLDWPALTSFIHVDDVVKCLIKIGDHPPEPGMVCTYLLATESKTLADVSRLIHHSRGLEYRMVSLPKSTWRALANFDRSFCRWGAWALPTRIYNAVWRFNSIVNPVFHCDTSSMKRWFPDLEPKLMADCIKEI